VQVLELELVKVGALEISLFLQGQPALALLLELLPQVCGLHRHHLAHDRGFFPWLAPSCCLCLVKPRGIEVSEDE